MTTSITVRDIRALCGEAAYWRGLSYISDGQAFLTGRSLVPEQYRYQIGGGRKYYVTVVNTDGKYVPECTCLASATGAYCKHIAAALLLLANAEEDKRGEPDSLSPGDTNAPGDRREASDSGSRPGKLKGSSGVTKAGHGSREGDMSKVRRGFHDGDARKTGHGLGEDGVRMSEHGSRDGDVTSAYHGSGEGEANKPGHESGSDNRKHYGAGERRGKSYLRGTSDRDAIADMLGLFGNRSSAESNTAGERIGIVRDERELLELCPVLQLVPRAAGHMVRLELRVSAKRSYIVHRSAAFLEAVANATPFTFTGQFSYDPTRHRFSPQDETLIRKLSETAAEEQRYRNVLLQQSGQAAAIPEEERYLSLPPFAWDGLLPLLQGNSRLAVEVHHARAGKAPVRFDSLKTGMSAKLPLVFKIGRSSDGDGDYALRAWGMRDIIVLADYGFAFGQGTLYRLPPARLNRLSGLKTLLDAADFGGEDYQYVGIAPEQATDFMQTVVPGLATLGKVEIAPDVSERLWYQPLKARLYLDRVRGKLLAGLEFQYGDIVINPLEQSGGQRGTDLIVMRDGEKEGRILKLLEHESFGKTEGGYIIEGDDEEYGFLYGIVPLLEQELDVFATSAVKIRMVPETVIPKIVLSWEEKSDWLNFSFKLDGISEGEIRAVVEAVAEKRRYFKLRNGALMPLEGEAFSALLRVMNGIGLHRPTLLRDVAGGSMKLPVSAAAALLELPEHGSNVAMNKPLRELLDNLRHPGGLDFALPDGLSAELRDYQKYGFMWMKNLAAYRFGGILADEMGLGKTVQSIAFLLSVLTEIRQYATPALIVAPSSLMYNWSAELAKFAPGIKFALADGSSGERVQTLELYGDGPSAADVIITSYPLLRRDALNYSARSFHTLILDEAQMFKNDYTQTAQAVMGLKAQHAFALTGTPIENRLDELWSIFRVVFPGLFPDKERFGEMTRESIAKRSRPFLLRRLKSDVLPELPEKIESLQTSRLLPEQKTLYAAYLAKLKEDTLKHLDSDDFGKIRIRLLAGITRLRQICCHPGLFVEGYEGDSAKFRQLMELLAECQSAGKRVLVFSQFTSMLQLIGQELGYLERPYFYLDGGTPPAERVELCGRFNEGERDIFLLSLKAGGTGLNLTGADTVILYDLWWNPAVEQQAADRAHRIGQRKVVQIIRMVSEGTVEEKMMELQQRKRNLIDEVIEPGSEALSSLSEQDVRELLSL